MAAPRVCVYVVLFWAVGCRGGDPLAQRLRNHRHKAGVNEHRTLTAASARAGLAMPVNGPPPAINGGPLVSALRKSGSKDAPSVDQAELLRIAPASPVSCRGPYEVTDKITNGRFATIELSSELSSNLSVTWQVSALCLGQRIVSMSCRLPVKVLMTATDVFFGA